MELSRPAIGLPTLLAYFVGRERAIRTIAATPSALWLGFLFVTAAAFAREYDRRDLLVEWPHLLLPASASLAISFIQFLFFWVRRSPASTATFASAYRAFLTCFWMTAPVALFYAIPYERFLTEGEAVAANFYTLFFVSLWRGLLIVRVLHVLGDVGHAHGFVVLLTIADVSAQIVLAVLPVPIFDVMAGTAQTPAVRVFAEAAFLVQLGGVAALFILGPLSIYYVTARRTTWRAIDVADRGHVGAPLWATAALLIAGFVATLPFTQPPWRIARKADALLSAGQFDDGLALLVSRPADALPPGWRPVPHVGLPVQQPNLLDIAERAVRLPADSWVRCYYVEEAARVYLGFHSIDDEATLSQFRRTLAMIDSIPEGRAIRAEYADGIAYLERNIEHQTELTTTQPSPTTTPTTNAATQPATQP